MLINVRYRNTKREKKREKEREKEKERGERERERESNISPKPLKTDVQLATRANIF